MSGGLTVLRLIDQPVTSGELTVLRLVDQDITSVSLTEDTTVVRAGEIGPAGPAGQDGPTGPTGPAGQDGTGSLYYGQINRMTSGTVTVAARGVYQTTGLAATLDPDSVGVGLGSAPFSVVNTAAFPRRVQITATYDASVTGPAAVLGLQLALNGNPVTDTECRATTSAAGAIAKLHTTWLFELQPGEEVQLQVANHSNTTAINFQRGRVVVNGVTGGFGDTGPTGPQGPPGPVQALSFSHVQNVPSAIWVIQHDLGFEPAGILIFDSSGNTVEGAILLNNNSITEIQFASAFAGTATLS